MEGAGVPAVAAVPGGGLARQLVTPLIFLNSSGLLLYENLLFFNHLKSYLDIIQHYFNLNHSNIFFYSYGH